MVRSSQSVHCLSLQNKRVNINKDELKSTSKAIETVHNLCCNENKGATELVAELGTLYQCIRCVVVTIYLHLIQSIYIC